MSITAAERAALGKELLAVIGGGNPDSQKIAALIAAGAGLEETSGDIQKRTPLLVACATSGCEEAAALLLKAGANTEARNENGATSLMMAALVKNTELVGLLVSHRAQLNDTGFKGMTPLMWAANLGARDIVRQLLAAGADGEITSPKGKRAADFAEDNGKPHIAKDIQDHIQNRKAAKAAFAAAIAAGIPLENDVTPLHMPALKRRQPKNRTPR